MWDSTDQLVRQSSLEPLNVLIDGYNLQMPGGTGIKTYTISLIQALQYLGLKSLVLTGLPDSNDPVLSEVLLADERARQEMDLRQYLTLGGYGQAALKLLKYLVKLWCQQPHSLSLSDRVAFKNSPMSGLLQADHILNLEGCYETSRLLYSLFRQQTTIRCRQPIDLWHRTYPILPLKVPLRRPHANVVTICDVIPLKLPYLTRDRKKDYYYTLKTVLQERPMVTTISEHSRQDILEFFDIDPDRICVTYLPIAPTPLTDESHLCKEKYVANPLENQQLLYFLQRYRLKPQDYLLFVGTIEPRKNLSLLLKAYLALDSELPLVIVGKRGWRAEQDLDSLESMFGRYWYQRVKLLDFSTTHELTYLYQGAFCLIFPSLYEGFGLPPLEAMSWGCPVISSDRSSLPEVCGDAALYFNPYDAAELQTKLTQLLNDSYLRHQLIQRGIARAKQFNLDNFSQKLWHAYTQVL
ncbi:glycosyltransferase family 4 protein [Nostoc spongiaeforme FACHB-130]|uniref:Glycosyltransferase family 4 protein n=1 Tax=Nostoc spongiaeforme FACHB-130 TaxID=1357510 RepID=A0ABR8G059_9NOSO|nr:glycosyltransferase family 1 protein [Nostoc spongiaeforme]MBD2596600.1 glycosyltransferase family 4 protein [Nostoc spongiaeforme FACHB-130]